MEPKFRQQSFVSDNVEIQLNNEMFGFDYFAAYQGKYLNEMQAQQNKTYMVFLANFVFMNGTQNQKIPLEIIKCKSPQLQGLNCFDFSKLPYQALILKNNSQDFSYINFLAYRCSDVDWFKTFVPNNCADEQSIDNLFNLYSFVLQVKTQVSQFNVSSQTFENQYKSQTFLTTPSIFQYNEFKIQSQSTSVKQGYLIQQEQIFSSPFSYQIVSQAYPLDQITKTRGIKSLCQVLLIADESVNYFSIQFPIYTEVLAICNSSLALLLLFGIFCRKLAQNFIRRDILFILMKNFFSGTYLNLLQHNNLSNNTNQTVEVNLIQDENIQEKQIEEGEEVKKDILLPCLTPNSSQRVFLQLLSNPKISTEQDYIQEDFESEAKKAEKYIDSLRVTEKKEISLQINQDKKIDVKNSTNIINENEIIQKQFKNVSKQSQQFYQNNNSNNKQRMRGSTSYTHQSVLQKFDQSNQEHEIINFKNSCSQINKCFQNLNDKSLQLKLEQIFSKTVEIEQKVDDSLDFYAFYKDILLLKKAIMVILNKEQFAALQVIGIDLETINKSQDKIKLDNQEGWVKVKRGWFWQQRYGVISQGNFKYYDDQGMNKLKRDFMLKDVQIVQDRMNKIIKFLQGGNEQLQIKTDLHELWYQKLIQEKVQSMNIYYIPQFQAQEQIRRNQQSPNAQLLEQQNINPNDVVSPLQLANTNPYSNIQQPINQFQFNPLFDYPLANQNQERNMQSQALNQTYIQNEQLVRQRVAPQLANQGSNQIKPQNRQNIQQNQFNRQIPQNFQQELQQKKKDEGVISMIKDFIFGKKEDYYDEKFVSELNNNDNLKMQMKEKIEEIILPITTQTDLFSFEQYSNSVKFNFMQLRHLQNIFDKSRNMFPIKILLSIFLMLIVIFNLMQWQKRLLIYTFCSITIIQFCALYYHLKSKQVAIKCNVQALTAQSLNISNMYTINQLLDKLRQINQNIVVYEQAKNKELFILDKNVLFQSVYQIQIKDSKSFLIQIFTKNYEYLDSIIENFSSNFKSKTGIWKERQQAPPSYHSVLEALGSKLLQYQTNYQIYKEKEKHPHNEILYVVFNIIKDNWQFVYEICCLVLLLHRLSKQQEIFNWSCYTNWFLIMNYGITFTKLTYYIEEICLSLRTDIKRCNKIYEKTYNYYYKKDIYKIAFNQQEIKTQDKINDVEVLFVCLSFFIAFIFRDWTNLMSIIFLPVLKPTFLKRHNQIFKIIFTEPFAILCSVLKLSCLGFVCIFFGIQVIIRFLYQLYERFSTTESRSRANYRANQQQIQHVQIKFSQASSIQNYQQQECTICLEEYKSARDLVFCCKNKHFYHKDCILRWINSGNFSATRKCPLCRADLF